MRGPSRRPPRNDPPKPTRVQTLCRELPKAELHLHLDGSLTQDFLIEQANARRVRLVSGKVRDFLHRRRLNVERQNPEPARLDPGQPMAEDLEFCQQFLLFKSELRDSTRRLVDCMHCFYNAWIVELRFCPSHHTNMGMSEREAIDAVAQGFKDCAYSNSRLRGGIIICADRTMGVESVNRVLELAAGMRSRHKCIIGGDIYGESSFFDLAPFRECIDNAVSKGLPMTVHALESGTQGVANIKIAVEAGAQRLGNCIAVGSGDDDELLEYLAKSGVAVETCMTGSLRRDRYESPAAYPVQKMLDKGVNIAGFNTDNMIVGGTLQFMPTPENELQRAIEDSRLSLFDIRTALINAFDASFDSRLKTQRDYRKDYIHAIDEAVAKYFRPYEVEARTTTNRAQKRQAPAA